MKNILLAILILITFISPVSNAQLTPTETVAIPMRDGKNLAADIYIPTSCASCPTILIQTPYNKNSFNNLPLGFLQDIDASPYVWVIVDWRGFYASSAAVVAQPNRGQDGYDVIEWITEQSWSNGKVGTWGPSALGVIQYQTAKEQHPAHICAVPLVAHPQMHYQGYFYGGALEKSRLETMDALGYGLSTTVLANPYYNATWQFVENNGWYPSSITIPTLQIGGWYDHNIDKMMDWYEATRLQSATAVRNKQWLLVGPWVHGGTGAAYVGSSSQGDLSYPNAAFESDVKARAFLAHYLLNEDNGWDTEPLITYYETGLNSWESSNAVSIEQPSDGILYLSGNGRLQFNTGIGETEFSSDPNNPTPTIGGHTLSVGLDQGPYDQSVLDDRSDVLGFETDELNEEYTISGRVKVKLFVSSDRPDGDLVIRLIDVYPDGRNMLINDGIKRIRFRNGYTQADESFMTPGNVYEVEVELPFVHYTWLQGHKMKIFVSGNSSTRWDVNLQDGLQMYSESSGVAGAIQIHHNVNYASLVMLPGNSSVLSLEEHTTSDITVYPNPVVDYFRIDKNFELIESIEIYSSDGKIVDAISVTQTNHIVCSHWDSGFYYILIQADGRVHQFKVLKI
jgi:predicted acyl esterase